MEFENWTVDDVQIWLKSEKVNPAVTEQFRLQEINGEALLTLEEADLVSLGLETMGPRRVLYKKIQKLRGVDIVKLLHERDSAPRIPITEDGDGSGLSGHAIADPKHDADDQPFAAATSNGSRGDPAISTKSTPARAMSGAAASSPLSQTADSAATTSR